MHSDNQIGHIGGNLSSLDAMLYLHHCQLEDNDSFVLSKGHSAGALYITLWTLGEITDSQLNEFHKDNSKMAGHPVPLWHDSISVATGSLGHGFPMACGLALAKRYKNNNGHVFCLCSDGEWQEGSNWEALIFSHHHKLSNLTVIIDNNGLQGFGSLDEVASMGSLKRKIESFGLEVLTGNGHDYESLKQCLSKGSYEGVEPRIVLLNTIKGNGISFMENKMEWHYLPLDEAAYRQAYSDVEK